MMETKSSLVSTVVALGDVDAQALVDLVPPDAAEIVALRAEEDPLQRRARRLHVRRLTGPQERVDGVKRLGLVLRRVLLDRVLDRAGSRRAGSAGRSGRS